MAQTQTGEAGLKVSNEPSDGKYLQYKDDTDKLTWADVPAGVGGANGVDFDDNVNARFGAGNDLVLYSDGTQGIIRSPNGRGYIQSDTGISISNIGYTEKYIEATKDGNVELFFDNAKKAETVTGGFTVTGVCTATSFAGDGSALTGIASTSLDGCGYQNDQTIAAGSYSIPAGKGMHSVGPITNNGTVTINGRWVIS